MRALTKDTLKIAVMMPVYEDWPSALELCRDIDAMCGREPSYDVRVLFVDDGSTASSCPPKLPFTPRDLRGVSCLPLRRNLGHQRAIAIGLSHLHRHWTADAVVVMDADGEDRAEDIPLLLHAAIGPDRRVGALAERGKRLEHTLFRAFYGVYRGLHRLLTGRDIRFGNFSALPWSYLDVLVLFPEMWNHYAATVLKSRLPHVRVRCDRAKRKSGKSHMDFVSLVIHGISALLANQELVGTRLLVMLMMLSVVLFTVIGTVVGIRVFTSLGIPGWATSTIGLASILVGQALIAAFLLMFSTMMQRNQLGFLPVRDYAFFAGEERPICAHE